MTNNNDGITTDVQIAGNTLDEVQIFKYIGAIISEEGSKHEVLARIVQATAALSSRKIVWKYRNITLRSKIRLMRYLVISIFVYACETWTLTADLQCRIQTMKMRSYTEHVTDEEVNGDRRSGGQRNLWEDNIKDWMVLHISQSLRELKDRKG